MLQHRLTNLFTIGRALEFLPLVIKVATLRQADANLDAASQEVNVERNQREALLLGTFSELVKFAFVNQQLARTLRLMIHQIGLRVFVNVGADQPQLPVANARVSFFDRNLRVANTLHFAADQCDPAFQLVDDVVLVPRSAVRADVLRVWIDVVLFLFTFFAGHLGDFSVKNRLEQTRLLNGFTPPGEYKQFDD